MRFARRLPSRTLTLVPGAGHMVHHSAAETVLQALQSLLEAAGSQTAPQRRRQTLRGAGG